jgi:hypothetical protein
MLFAQHRTSGADLGALFREMHMMRRTARHEIRVHIAHLGAIEQRDKMFGFAMNMAAMQHMRRGLSAEAMAFETVSHALPHLAGHRRQIHEIPFISDKDSVLTGDQAPPVTPPSTGRMMPVI